MVRYLAAFLLIGVFVGVFGGTPGILAPLFIFLMAGLGAIQGYFGAKAERIERARRDD